MFHYVQAVQQDIWIMIAWPALLDTSLQLQAFLLVLLVQHLYQIVISALSARHAEHAQQDILVAYVIHA